MVMPSPIDAAELASATFTAGVMRQIFQSAVPGETGADRLRQVGLMILIYNLQLRGIEATTSEIEQVSGADRRAIYDMTKALEAKGLLKRSSVTNRHNKGRVFKYVIPDGLMDPLAV